MSPYRFRAGSMGRSKPHECDVKTHTYVSKSLDRQSNSLTPMRPRGVSLLEKIGILVLVMIFLAVLICRVYFWLAVLEFGSNVFLNIIFSFTLVVPTAAIIYLLSMLINEDL